MKHDLQDHELTLIRQWYKFDEKIKKFQNSSSVYTFNEIFGKTIDDDGNETLLPDEGYRLFQHFRFDCNHDYKKFKTYLTNDQYNALLVYIVRLK